MVVLAGLLSLTQAALGGDLSEWPGGDGEWEACLPCTAQLMFGPITADRTSHKPSLKAWSASVVENIVATGPMSGAIRGR